MINPKPIVFSTREYEWMASEIRALTGYDTGLVDRKHFPDGELYQRVRSEIPGKKVVVVGGTTSESATLELYDLCCALTKNGALSLTMVIPYYGYSTMERAVKTGEVVVAKTRARLLSSIPPASEGNRVVLLDLHVESIAHYFEGGIMPVHLSARPVILREIKRLGGDDFVLACTDAGRAKWVESLANDMGVTAAFVFKRRIDGERTEVTAMSAMVQGKTVVLFDDMIRTGGSLINAARAYKDAGAKSIAAIATHGVFPGNALGKIRESGLFSEMVVTDSHPHARELKSDFLKVVNVAEVFADFLKKELAQN